MNILVIEADFITNRIDRGVPLKDLEIDSFKSDIISFELVRFLHFFIVTDSVDQVFRYMKNIEANFDITKITYPMSELQDHLKGIAKWECGVTRQAREI